MATTRKIRRVSTRTEDGSVPTTSISDDDTDAGSDGATDTATTRLVDFEKRFEDVNRRLKQISDESARAIGKAVQVSDQLETLKNETLENMQVAFDENAEVLESIEKDVTDMKDKLGDDLKAELEGRIAAIERSRDTISADVKILKSDAETLKRSLAAQIEQRMPEIDHKIAAGLEQAQAHANEVVAKTGGRLDELEVKFAELDEERGALAKRDAALEGRLKKVTDDLGALSTRVSTELDKAAKAWQEVEKALQSANGAVQRSEEATKRIDALHEKLSQAEAHVDEVTARLQDTTSQLDAGRDRVSLALKIAEDVEDKIHRLVAPVDDALAQMEEFEAVHTEGELGFELNDLLQVMIKHNASDLHLKVGAPPTVRLDGELIPVGNQVLTENDCKRLVFGSLNKTQRRRLLEKRELDFAYSIPSARFRINAFLTRGTVSAAFRMQRQEMPTMEELGLPAALKKLASYNNGLILVTGPAGAGKSTTLSALVDYINTQKKMHIVTVEDPIEFVHRDKLSIITQREVGTDTTSFQEALKQALRQDPNVIMIGEMRDPETIMTAVIAAETGHLVLSSMHTPNTIQAIDRIIDVFSGEQQRQFRMLLANTLRGVVSQRLLTRSDEQGRVPAMEVLVVTPTISSLILEGKTNEIYPYIQQGASEGMQTFTSSLTRLFEAGLITKEEAMYHADQPTEFRLTVEGHSSGSASYSEGDTLMNWL